MECVPWAALSSSLSLSTDSWQAGVLASCYTILWALDLGWAGLRRSTKIERVSRDIPWDELGVTTTLVFLNTTHLTRKEHQHAWLAGAGQRYTL